MDGTTHRLSQDDPIPLGRPKNLTLYVLADQPTEADRRAEAAVKEFDPSIRVERVGRDAGTPTPRLRYARGSFWGLSSIQSFIDQTRVQETSGRPD